jgi:hypothetical protein
MQKVFDGVVAVGVLVLSLASNHCHLPISGYQPVAFTQSRAQTVISTLLVTAGLITYH